MARSIDSLFNELMDDVLNATRLWADSPSPFSRRTYIRTVFAFVEGMIQIMKSASLLFHEVENLNLLTSEEIILLKEEEAYVKQNGSVAIKSSKISLAPNFRFTMLCANKVFELNHLPDVGSQGWEDFNKAIQIRNRITHPGEHNDLDITDKDIEIVNKGMDYFRDETLPFVKGRKI